MVCLTLRSRNHSRVFPRQPQMDTHEQLGLPATLPSLPHLALAGLGLLVSYFTISTVYSWYRLRHIPGPPFAALSYLWQFRVGLSGRRAEIYRHVNQEYGPLARIGPNELLANDPKLIMQMSAVRATFTRSSWYAAFKFNPYVDNMANILDTAAHDRLRAKMTPGYSGKENPSIEGDVDEQLASLVSLVRRCYISEGDQYRPMGMVLWLL